MNRLVHITIRVESGNVRCKLKNTGIIFGKRYTTRNMVMQRVAPVIRVGYTKEEIILFLSCCSFFSSPARYSRLRESIPLSSPARITFTEKLLNILGNLLKLLDTCCPFEISTITRSITSLCDCTADCVRSMCKLSKIDRPELTRKESLLKKKT